MREREGELLVFRRALSLSLSLFSFSLSLSSPHKVHEHVVVDLHVALLPGRVRVDVQPFTDLGLGQVAVELGEVVAERALACLCFCVFGKWISDEQQMRTEEKKEKKKKKKIKNFLTLEPDVVNIKVPALDHDRRHDRGLAEGQRELADEAEAEGPVAEVDPEAAPRVDLRYFLDSFKVIQG